MWAAVSLVAGFAAVISYTHIYGLGRAHGGSVLDSALLPLAIDGLIVAASLLLLHEALQGRRAPFLAWLLLSFGVAATVTANVSYGAAWGLAGALIWACPALAFVGAVEALAMLLRRSRRPQAETAAGIVSVEVPASAEDAARMAFRASVAGGNPLSMNKLTANFGVTRSQARAILVAANGHGQAGA